jgi:hypothetical protein
MNPESSQLDNPLDDAETRLREIFQRRLPSAPAEAGALGRILAHVVNIRRSVSESSLDHVNAAKRLTDFAVTINRMAQHLLVTDEDTAARMTDLAATLRLAAAQLSASGATPQQNSAADAAAQDKTAAAAGNRSFI